METINIKAGKLITVSCLDE